MDLSSSLKAIELGNLVVSSGLLHSSWKMISETCQNPASAVGFKTHTEAEFTYVVFKAPPISRNGKCNTSVLPGSQDPNPFHFLCSEEASSFSCQLFASAYDEYLRDLKPMLLNFLEAKKLVVITGAGSGGSVASLFTLWLLETINPKFKRPLCITFGSPLIGDAGLPLVRKNSVKNSCFLHVAQPKTRIREDFKPFGTFLICYESECICIEDPEAVLDLLNGVNADVPSYGEVLQRLDQSLLSMADSGLIPDDVIKRVEESEAQKKIRYDPSRKLTDIKISMAHLEWYKKKSKKDNIGGYYDRFKTRTSSPPDSDIEKRKKEANIYWKAVVEDAEKKLPFGERSSILSRRFLFSANNYRRMFEPLDIAEYYRDGRREYRSTGRSHHYVMLEKWFKDEISESDRDETNNLSDLLMSDSCFWAEVEESLIVLHSLNPQEGTSDIASMRKLVSFEEYVWGMICKSEVSPEIFLEKSSFMRWWREYKELKARDGSYSPSHFTEFMNSGKYQTYGQ